VDPQPTAPNRDECVVPGTSSSPIHPAVAQCQRRRGAQRPSRLSRCANPNPAPKAQNERVVAIGTGPAVKEDASASLARSPDGSMGTIQLKSQYDINKEMLMEAPAYNP
jgi:hypothetical protein